MQGAQVQSLVRELRSHMLWVQQQKKEKEKKEFNQQNEKIQKQRESVQQDWIIIKSVNTVEGF